MRARALAAGNLKFTLHGHKMHGNWVLVRMKGKGEKQPAWLLIKEKDDYTRPALEYSVVDELPDSVKSKPMPKRKKAAAQPAAPASALPATLTPQLATLVDAPPADAERLDFRTEIRRLPHPGPQRRQGDRSDHAQRQRLDAQTGASCSRPWKRWACRQAGMTARSSSMARMASPSFGALQQAFDKEATSDIVYYLFDVPYFDGHDLRGQPVEARRALLGQLLDQLPTSPLVRFSDELDATPAKLLATACKLGLEGVIGKRRGSRYTARRSNEWIKLKCGLRQEFVIGGFTEPQGARSGIGSLLLGTHDKDGKLHYAGNVGSGFDQDALLDLRRQLDALIVDTSPYAGKAGGVRRATWVKPTLVAEVSFAQWTSAGADPPCRIPRLAHGQAGVRHRARAAASGQSDKGAHPCQTNKPSAASCRPA